jgi:antitoxin component HigA of HigAB toxin-antitoxin module
MTTQERILFAIRDERDYTAALEEFDNLVLSEPGTPPGRRFDELVHLIDEYATRRSGYVCSRRGVVVSMTTPACADARRTSSLQQRIGKTRQVLHRPPP